MIFNLLFLLFSFPAFATVKTVATTPDVAWLLHRIGGEQVEVRVLARGGENYHYFDARPDFILAVNRAQLVCRVGADLEIGWLPKIFEKAANPKVMPGSTGDCDLSRAVTLEEKPTGPIDRSMGDVHGAGNPHFWFSPSQMAKAALEVEAKLAAVDSANGDFYKSRRETLQKELMELEAALSTKLKEMKGKKIFQYHRDFTYFASAYGLKLAGSIEEIPGVSPSAARLGNASLEAKNSGALLALAANYDPRSPLAKFQELSGLPVVRVATSLKNPSSADAYRVWQESIAEALLKAVK